jgi:hypothetical protein
MLTMAQHFKIWVGSLHVQQKKMSVFARLIFRAAHNKTLTYIFYFISANSSSCSKDILGKPKGAICSLHRGGAGIPWRALQHQLPTL